MPSFKNLLERSTRKPLEAKIPQKGEVGHPPKLFLTWVRPLPTSKSAFAVICNPLHWVLKHGDRESRVNKQLVIICDLFLLYTVLGLEEVVMIEDGMIDYGCEWIWGELLS